ncbi:daptide-type RiPP biosynthesis methyltransferase [Amycolatopsis sp. cmx-11-12]|uniref:daptide-type RiPP biosynthesis methyltransferase n=1 Tax=Amycolatopsis sp. cmx-11-12 TaxID=2785795 RepID=UPI00391700D1
MTENFVYEPVRTAYADTLLASVGERGVLCDYYAEEAKDIYQDLMDDEDESAIAEAKEYSTRIRPGSGPVLELAVGTGRVTFPLLELGFEVTALELSDTMLDVLRRRLRNAPKDVRDRCTVVQGDMGAFKLDKRFGTVIISPGTLSVLDDDGRAGLYASVREHLAPGGRFLVGVGQQDPAKSEPEERSQELSGKSGREYVLHHARLFSGGDEINDITIYPADKTADPFVVCTHRMRIPPMDPIVREFEQAGFAVTVRPFTGKRPEDVLMLEASL